MKIIIDIADDTIEGISFEEDNGGKSSMSYDTLLAVIFCILENVASSLAEDKSEDYVLWLYEHFNAVFDKFMERVFPEVSARPFDLTDAAVLYAQDQIIEDAARKGITYDEALAAFEEKAKQHIIESKGITS